MALFGFFDEGAVNQSIGSSGNRCRRLPSSATISQFTVALSAAFFKREISRPLIPAFPPFNWIRRTSNRSGSFRPSRNAIASMMPVRGAPVSPSKKTMRQPCFLQCACNASLLCASAAWATVHAFMRFFVTTAFAAATRLLRVRAAFWPVDRKLGIELICFIVAPVLVTASCFLLNLSSLLDRFLRNREQRFCQLLEPLERGEGAEFAMLGLYPLSHGFWKSALTPVLPVN
jgi:hypothetical protein